VALFLSPEPRRQYIFGDLIGRKLSLDPFFYWACDELGCIPPGFKNDGTTIWDWLQSIIPKNKSRIAGDIHDWEYFAGKPRKLADKKWRDAAQSGNPSLNSFQAWAGYTYLRHFALKFYNRHLRGELTQGMDRSELIELSNALLQNSPYYGLPYDQVKRLQIERARRKD